MGHTVPYTFALLHYCPTCTTALFFLHLTVLRIRRTQVYFSIPKKRTCTEAAQTDPEKCSHDTWRDEFVNMENPQQVLWNYVPKYVDVQSGYLIANDTILDKPRGLTTYDL